MIFPFLKYVNPTWYFNLPTTGKGPFFYIDPENLTEKEKVLIKDNVYETSAGFISDLSYQAAQKGLLEGQERKNIGNVPPSIFDNYRFLRKYYHPLWSWYVLFIRLLSFHNPYCEIKAWISNLKTKRVNLYKHIYSYEEEYKQFDSPLVKSQPKVSVIIPTLNRYIYLFDVLKDLEKQDYKNFDVIIVDQSEPYQASFYDSFKLNLKIIKQTEKALWLARNSAVKDSKADYLLLFDDDSRVNSDWISEHLKTLDYFKADISSGVSISLVGAKVPENYSFFRLGDQVDTGNVLIHRRVFEAVGLFDQQFEKQRMGDGEFGLRAYLAGFKNISNPKAQRLHLKVADGGLRQMGHWDAFRPKKWWAPRPIPSVNYFIRKYFGDSIAILHLLINIPLSIMPYRFKRNNKILVIGPFLFILLSPIILVSIMKSWRISSKMLKKGASIERINAF